jgi:hypothetical protein
MFDRMQEQLQPKRSQDTEKTCSPIHPSRIQFVCILGEGVLLSGFEAQIRRQRGEKQFAFSLVTVVCLVLLALLATVQVAHLHPFDQDPDHCPLCIVMQTAAPVAVAVALVVMVRMGIFVPVPAPVLISRHRHPKLYIRPPPAGF